MTKDHPTTLRRLFPRAHRWWSSATWAFTNLSMTSLIGYAGFVEMTGQPVDPNAMLLLMMTSGLTLAASIMTIAGQWTRVHKPASVEEEDGVLVVTQGRKTQRLGPQDIAYVVRNKTRLWIGTTNGQLLEIRGLGENEAVAIEAQFGRRSFGLERRPPPRLGVMLKTMFAVVVVGGLIAGVLSITGDSTPVAAYAGSVLGGWVAFLWPAQRVFIGTDGIRAGKDIISYQELQEITSRNSRLLIVKRDGSEKSYPIRIKPGHAEALDRTLRPRIDAHGVENDTFGLRAQESAEAWIRRLKGAFRTLDYRQAAKNREDAKDILQSAKVPLRVRVGVAAALADTEPQLVKDALAGFSDPRMIRFANAAIDGDAELLEELVSEDRDSENFAQR